MGELYTKAVLVKCTFGFWDFTVEDKTISAETRKVYNMKGKTGKFTKVLINPRHLARLRHHHSAMKTHYYTHTLPYEDRGPKLLSMKLFQDFTSTMNNLIERYERVLVPEFLAEYSNYVNEARYDLGTAWKEEDYPDPKYVAGRYHASMNFFTIPNTEDLRLDVDDVTLQRFKDRVTKDLEAMYHKAMYKAWDRLFDVVDEMQKALADPEKVFRDTKVTNIERLVDLLPSLNIMDDPKLNQMAQAVKDRLTFHDPETLRENRYVRQAVADDAGNIREEIDSIMAKMEGVWI